MLPDRVHSWWQQQTQALSFDVPTIRLKILTCTCLRSRRRHLHQLVAVPLSLFGRTFDADEVAVVVKHSQAAIILD